MPLEIREPGTTVVVSSNGYSATVTNTVTDVAIKTGIVQGVRDYNYLYNKPSIEDVELIGDKSFPELGIFIDPEKEYPSSDEYAMTTVEITELWNAIAS